MKWLTLTLIKANSRIETNEEDDLITLYGNSAERQVLNDTGRTVDELKAMNEDDTTKVPDDIIHASLMLSDFAYRQRSPVDTMNWAVVPYTYERIIKPYVRLTNKEDE